MPSEVQPRTIIAGEDNEGFFFHTGLAERIHDITDLRINVGHRVSVRGRSLTFELLRRAKGRVRHRGRQVEKERLTLAGILPNKTYRAKPLHRGQGVHVGPVLHSPERDPIRQPRQRRVILGHVPRHVAQRPHVIGVGDHERLVEAMSGREKLWIVPQVPFTHDTRMVASFAQKSAQRFLRRTESQFRIRGQGRPAQAQTIRIAA